ncbi:MAG: NAD-dependent epimerase/dehydratase family protein, partial [Bdellovibrionales bacterium]|nr:NAD-dependent epimerase/dehydratase family protein [Bdellovibrionales bacterium]
MNAQINAESVVLVTGAAGFIGSEFIELVHGSTDAQLVILDKLTYAGNRKTYRHAIEQAVLKRERNGLRRDHAAPEFVEGDICDRE